MRREEQKRNERWRGDEEGAERSCDLDVRVIKSGRKLSFSLKIDFKTHFSKCHRKQFSIKPDFTAEMSLSHPLLFTLTLL